MDAPKTTLEKIGRYKVLERVGKGGMGVLYRGFDPVLDREVAIKLMHADFSEDTEQMRPRFYREARAAAKLQHRNIVTIFEFAEESNVPYIVMEFLRGTPLGARITGQPQLTLDDKMNIVAQLCDGLAYAHDQGVVHRDVKPDNVFILEDGSVKLLDFGIAKLTSSNLTRQGDVLGSASYMSPEQVGGSDSVDGRADVFSTGVVLYELLSGKKPFQADSPTAVIVKILKDEPVPLESVAPDVPAEVTAIVMKALQKDPANRYQSAGELARALQSLRKNMRPALPNLDETRFASTHVMRALHDDYQRSHGGIPAATQVTPAPPPPSRNWVMPAVGGAVVVLVAAIGFAMFSRSAPSAPAAAATTTAAVPAPANVAPATSAPAAATGAAAPADQTPGRGTEAALPSRPSVPPPPTAPNVEARRPAAPAPAPAAAASVPVSLSGAYPFAVYDGNKAISAAATSHELKLPAGKSVRIQAPDYYLSQTVRIQGSPGQPFEYAAPGLGTLAVRSSQETCDVVIAGRKLGNPPLVVKDIAAGSYKVEINCAGETVRTQQATVQAGQNSVANLR